MSDLRAAIRLITGEQADEQQIQHLMAIAQALRIPHDDAMMPILAMLESYNRLYANLPDKVAGKCKTEADLYAKAAAAGAQRLVSDEIAKTMTGLVSAAREGIVTASQSVVAIEKAKAVAFATKVAAGGVLACAVLFTGLGWGAKSIGDYAERDSLKTTLATERAQHLAAVEVANAGAKAEIASMAKSVGWLGTREGRLAHKFFEGSGGMVAATCAGKTWEVVTDKDDVKWCVPKPKPFFGGNDQQYGWKLP